MEFKELFRRVRILDTRHTFITLADKYQINDVYLKLIVGHSVTDITKGVYTHKNTEELII